MKKNAGGRPTKLNDELLENARYYIDNYKDLGDAVPTIVGLAIHLDISTSTAYNWAIPENVEFLDIFNKVEQKQHRDLVNGGLVGGFNPAVSKMMLTKHGYSDKVEQSHTSPDGTMTPKTIQLVPVTNDNKAD